MSSDTDPRFSPGDEPDDHFEDEEAPRSIFSATWFRVVIVVLAVGVIGAISVPYVLDVVSAPTPQTAATSEPATTPPATTPSAPASSEATTSPATPASPPTVAQSAAPSEGGAAATSTPPAAVAKPTEPPKATEKPKASEKPKATEKPKAPDKAPAVAATPKASSAPAASSAKKESPAKAAAPARAKQSEGGDYFVQVGAFQDQATAQRLASRLRDQNYPVDESMTRGGSAPSAAPRPTPRVAAATGPDRYDVIVSGGTTAEINSRLSAKGLASEPAGESVRIRPSLSLRDAVALSKDLGSEGFKVQVRRGAGGGAAPAASAAAEPAPSATVGDGPALYRVRVGPYPDRAAAVAVHREFQDKGYQPFIAKGRE